METRNRERKLWYHGSGIVFAVAVCFVVVWAPVILYFLGYL